MGHFAMDYSSPLKIHIWLIRDFFDHSTVVQRFHHNDAPTRNKNYHGTLTYYIIL